MPTNVGWWLVSGQRRAAALRPAADRRGPASSHGAACVAFVPAVEATPHHTRARTHTDIHRHTETRAHTHTDIHRHTETHAHTDIHRHAHTDI